MNTSNISISGKATRIARISVAFVDDHPILIEAISEAFARVDAFEVVATGNNAGDIIRIGSTHSPDVIVVDVDMPGDVLAAIKNITEIAPATRLVAYTAFENVRLALRVLSAGAKGYVTKGSSAEELMNAVHSVHHGKTFITQSLSNDVVAALSEHHRVRSRSAAAFTAREKEILHFLVRGYSNKKMAAELSLSDKTVKNHMRNIAQKMQVRNRLEMMLAAKEFIQADDDFMPGMSLQ